MKWDLNGNFLNQQHFFSSNDMRNMPLQIVFFLLNEQKSGVFFTFLNERYCFCLLKPYSSTVESFIHVPLV